MYRNYISHPSRVWRNTSHYSLHHGIISLASFSPPYLHQLPPPPPAAGASSPLLLPFSPLCCWRRRGLCLWRGRHLACLCRGALPCLWRRWIRHLRRRIRLWRRRIRLPPRCSRCWIHRRRMASLLCCRRRLAPAGLARPGRRAEPYCLVEYMLNAPQNLPININLLSLLFPICLFDLLLNMDSLVRMTGTIS